MAEQLTALSIMQNAPVIPVIVLHDVDHAVSMAKALVGGGIRVLEVTLRTPQGLPSIEAIAKAVPEAIVGAGTVRSSAPHVGDDTDAVLAELGLSAEQIAKRREKGIVQ